MFDCWGTIAEWYPRMNVGVLAGEVGRLGRGTTINELAN